MQNAPPLPTWDRWMCCMFQVQRVLFVQRLDHVVKVWHEHCAEHTGDKCNISHHSGLKHGCVWSGLINSFALHLALWYNFTCTDMREWYSVETNEINVKSILCRSAALLQNTPNIIVPFSPFNLPAGFLLFQLPVSLSYLSPIAVLSI